MVLTRNVMVVCKSCNNKVPVGELKADDSGRWICYSCHQKNTGELFPKKVLKDKEISKSILSREKTPVNTKMQGRNESKFFCKICGYRFVRKGFNVRTPDICPYCSKKGVVVADYTAQDIITESSNLFEF